MFMRPPLLVRPSCVPENVGVNRKGHYYKNKWLALPERSQPKRVKPNIGDGKLRSGVNWHGALKKKGVRQRV